MRFVLTVLSSGGSEDEPAGKSSDKEVGNASHCSFPPQKVSVLKGVRERERRSMFSYPQVRSSLSIP